MSGGFSLPSFLIIVPLVYSKHVAASLNARNLTQVYIKDVWEMMVKEL